MNVSTEIRQRVKRYPRGKPFSPKSFLDIGGRSAVDKALARMTRDGAIDRVARGIYARPKTSRYFGSVRPALMDILRAIAKANGETLSVHGAEAVRALGLTTQSPVRHVFLTTGRSRRLDIDGSTVELQHTRAANLRLAGTQAGLAIVALLYLGQERVTEEVMSTIKKRIAATEWHRLEDELPRLPSWIASLVHAAAKAEVE